MSTSDYSNSARPAGGTTPADDATALAETAQRDLGQLGEEAKSQAAAIGKEVQSELGHAADKAKGLAEEQKAMFARHIGDVSEALGKVAGELEQGDKQSAGYLRMLADSAGKLTDTLEQNDVDDIIAVAQDFGRKQPVAFVGAAALLGFAASRFVLASASRKQDKAEAATPAINAGNGGSNGLV